MANDKIYLYPIWIRIWHWLNAVLFITLMITGISMQYSNPENPLLVSFELSVQLHNLCGILISINYLLFFIGNLFTSNGKQYKMKTKGLFTRLYEQSIFYLFGMFKKQDAPYPISVENKFNPLQRFIYATAMYVGFPIIIVSGLALFFPEIIIPQIFGISGILVTALLHSVIGFILSLFLFIHLYVCTIGSSISSNFKSMITGWH
ncbi:cytochrome b/b6 domain-containing protein [Labilibaculum sp. DW002]|uniref:Cytochrome b/b6 domain-containing protein n=1 Tax=Paralabilibaculum antarcticum TaxID=2912572 RepID=A0ABT5VM57_9BACT|nr:cytochrome b/b6 domain-containing protein [Labilibaculum sp. DW002]MDE5416516.1 cytochrome b/b6 domain-containing protein [Labilibaculum sp. DW002]